MKKKVDYKEKFQKFNEFRKTPRGGAALFFGFYFFFFLFIAILARMGGSRSTYSDSDPFEDKPYSFEIHSLLDYNYSYHYIITEDQTIYDSVGKKNGEKESFTFQKKEYYAQEDSYFVKDGIWMKSENPYVYHDFLDVSTLLDLIDVSFYESTISYESGKHTYNFLLSTNTINQKLQGVNSDFLEEPNQIIVSTDEENRINQIVLQLDSYCTLNKLCSNHLKIELQYDQFGEIEDIESPVFDS